MLHIVSNNVQRVSIVSLAGVSKTYRGFPALDHVSLELPAGLLSAVTGKSGSGKSTLLNLIAGIDRPTSGQVVVGGVDIGQLDESALAAWRGKNVGVVFQFFQLLPTLTIAENVMLPMDFAGVLPVKQQKEKALSLLDQVGIADQAGKLPSALSGGQQQRAAIARALANDPALVVADEPTGNLDSATADVVIGLLRGLTKRGTSVVIVTHDGELAREADRSVTLADGRIVREATLEVAHA